MAVVEIDFERHVVFLAIRGPKSYEDSAAADDAEEWIKAVALAQQSRWSHAVYARAPKRVGAGSCCGAAPSNLLAVAPRYRQADSGFRTSSFHLLRSRYSTDSSHLASRETTALRDSTS
jgi:hypothetical protein